MFWFHESQHQDYCRQYHDGKLTEVGPQVARVGGTTQHQGDRVSREDSHHVHDAVGGRPVTLRDYLAKYWHVVGIEHAKANPEEHGRTDQSHVRVADP